MITTRWSEAKISIVLFVLALAIRSLASVLLGISGPLSGDEPEYYRPAVSLAQGTGYSMVPQQSHDGQLRPTAYRMPGPAGILAAVFLMLGPGITLGRIISLVMSSLSAPLLYLYARRFVSFPSAIIAGLACTLYPTHVYYSLSLMSEPYFIPALLLALLLTVHACESGQNWFSGLAGLAWGGATMMRPHGLPLAMLVAAYLTWKCGWQRGVLLLLGVACFLAPWIVRNQYNIGHPVFLATEAGETLLGANNPYIINDKKACGIWTSPLRIAEYREHLWPIQDEVARNREQTAMALSWLKQNPDKIPKLVVRKLVCWLRPITDSGGAIRYLVMSSYGVLLLLLASGVGIRVFKQSSALHFNLLCTVFFTAVTIVYHGGLTRGRLPLEIIWIPFAALAAWSIWNKMKVISVNS